MKPLGTKAYGSIPHLPGSRLGPGDHKCHEGQAKIATEKCRKGDVVVVQTKLDGSNVSVAKINGEIVPLIRAGYKASQSRWKQHHIFNDWVMKERYRFDELLKDGERLCGEWLLQAHGTMYNLNHEPFAAFDIIEGTERMPYLEMEERVLPLGFTVPYLLSIGPPLSVEDALGLLRKEAHGEVEEVEGAVWRVENNGVVDFLCKFVRHDKVDGKYLDKEVWNDGLDDWFKRKVT